LKKVTRSIPRFSEWLYDSRHRFGRIRTRVWRHEGYLHLLAYPDVLRKANMESLLLIELLNALKERGFPLRPTIDPKDTLSQLTPLLSVSK
jgi:hypothetical protein